MAEQGGGPGASGQSWRTAVDPLWTRHHHVLLEGTLLKPIMVTPGRSLLKWHQRLQEALMCRSDMNDSTMEELVNALLGSFERLPMDCEKSTASGIWLTVAQLALQASPWGEYCSRSKISGAQNRGKSSEHAAKRRRASRRGRHQRNKAFSGASRREPGSCSTGNEALLLARMTAMCVGAPENIECWMSTQEVVSPE